MLLYVHESFDVKANSGDTCQPELTICDSVTPNKHFLLFRHQYHQLTISEPPNVYQVSSGEQNRNIVIVNTPLQHNRGKINENLKTPEISQRRQRSKIRYFLTALVRLEEVIPSMSWSNYSQRTSHSDVTVPSAQCSTMCTSTVSLAWGQLCVRNGGLPTSVALLGVGTVLHQQEHNLKVTFLGCCMQGVSAAQSPPRDLGCVHCTEVMILQEVLNLLPPEIGHPESWILIHAKG